MRAKCVVLIITLFFFLSVFGSSFRFAMADDNENISGGSQYQWELWKVIQNPQNPVAFPKGVYRTKKSCNSHIPHETSIYGEGPRKKGYVCLLKGLKPFSVAPHQSESNIGRPEEQSSPSGNGHG